MINIDYDKTNELKFTLDVTGHIGSIDEIRFILNKEDKKIVYGGHLEEGIVTVKLDHLNEIFDPGEYRYSLEIIIGNQYFKPIEDSINLKRGVKVISSVLEAKSEDSSNSIQVTKVETNKDTIELKEKVKDIIPETKVPKKKIDTKLSQFLVSNIRLEE